MLKPIPQDEALATYASKLKKEDAVLDWHQDTAAICRRVRGLRPWPVARTRWVALGGDRAAGENGGEHWLRVWMAAPESGESRDCAEDPDLKKPRECVGREGIRIAAADGWVLLTEVQPEGKRRMDAKAFWQGYRLPEGAVVG